MTRFFVPACLAILFSAGLAAAAGPYDGSWNGEVYATNATSNRSGFCNGSVTATITNNALRGTIQYGREARRFSGMIAPDGSFTAQGGSLLITGKFTGSSFEGTYPTSGNCGTYRMTLKHS